MLASLPVSGAEHLVQARPDLSFSPADLVVAAGDTVRFDNIGGFHNVRQVDGPQSLTPVPGGFCTPDPAPQCLPSNTAWSTTVLFDQPGVSHYICQVHGQAMRGQITVLAVDPDPAMFADGFEGP